MRPYTLSEIAEIVQGKILGGDIVRSFTSVTIDSRDVSPGDLFVAIRGERADGHDFVNDAALNGAGGAVVEKAPAGIELPDSTGFGVVKVESTVSALQRLAAHYRSELNTTVVGITGSVGKTSTKDLVAAVLSAGFSTYKSTGNLNSHIGLPLAILKAPETQYTVLEMAMRKRGEIAELSEISLPKIGILTDISASHVGILGGIDQIARAKAELLEALPPDGLALLCGDNDMVRSVAGRARCKTVFYGLDSSCDYHPVRIRPEGDAGSHFSVVVKGDLEEFFVPVPGRHQVQNAMAGVALGLELGLSLEVVRTGLKGVSMSPMRMEVIRTRGITVINDAYNASPKSMKAALDLLAEVEGKRKIAVLGDMLELGDYGVEAHREVGAYASEKADFLMAVGELGTYLRESWISERGYGANQVWFSNKSDAAEYLSGFLREGDVVLVKASRGMGFESIIKALVFSENREGGKNP